MSILSQVLSGKITFGEAAAKIAADASKLINSDPTLAQTVGAIQSDLKQAASEAVTMADSALGKYIAPATAGIEAAADLALAGVTGGKSIPFNPLINDGIDRIAAAIKSEADAWALKAKAALVTPPAATVTSAGSQASSAPQSQPGSAG